MGRIRGGLGHLAPALFSLVAILALPWMPLSPAVAQAAQQTPGVAPPSAVPVPSDLELAKLIWSTMAAVDQANQAGNYSVLRDLSSPAFQINNDPAQLTQIFANLRSSGVDLANTLLLAPTYNGPPTIPRPGVIRVRGFFGLRPTAIGFDLYYEWVRGKWRLFGISITPASILPIQPASQAPPAAPSSDRKRVRGINAPDQ